MEITAFQASAYDIRWYVITLWFVKIYKYLVSNPGLLKLYIESLVLYSNGSIYYRHPDR